MRNKVTFAICATILFVVIKRSQGKSMKFLEKKKTPQKRLDSLVHPCDTAPKNTVVQTVNGNIMCLKENEEGLQKQLEKTGGYNRRYLAASLSEAKRDFKNMFKMYGKQYHNTTDWQKWRYTDISSVQLADYSSVTPVPLIDANVLEPGQRKRNLRRKLRKGQIGSRNDDARQRRSNEDLDVVKRGSNEMNIQCLPGGRDTEKGIHLCPACQRCKELPEYVFPRYINELTCDDSESGFSSQTGCYLTSNLQIGNCQQVKMTVDLLVHKNGKFSVVFKNETLTKFKEVYEPFTYEIGTCCECMIFSSYAGV